MTHEDQPADGTSPFPEIDRVDVSTERLSAIKTDREFLGLAVDLMVEAGSYITIALNVLGSDRTWSKEQAAVGGNMVRLYKMFHGVLDQSNQGRGEMCFIFARLAFETTVSLKFLIQEHSASLIDEYIKHSMDHERRLSIRIQENISARGGIVLPIEDRMLKSIDRTLKSAGLTLDELPSKKIKNWGGKNLYEKAQAVGLGGAYLGMFSGPSNNVHGSWGDTYAHHIDTIDVGKFSPNIEWSRPRPQILFAISMISAGLAVEFSTFIGGDDVGSLLLPSVEDLLERIAAADRAHESYLSSKSWPAI
ncbi:DUF5677 domain-containing protein [Xanthobacteraceae bacterium A53D]